MSGHSHFKTVKHTKEAADKKRSKIFSKLTRMISVAAKAGSDPNANSKLRMAIDKAKEFNMPSGNIERAIKKGTGELGGEKLEEFRYEAIGPGKIAIIIEGISDNKNRTLAGVKKILSQRGGKLAQEGSQKWLFDAMGIIEIAKGENQKEELELLAIEAGAQDLRWLGDTLEIYTKPEDLEKTKQVLEDNEIKIGEINLGWVPKEEIELSQKDREAAQALFEALDENEDIQEIYSNVKSSV